MASSQSLAHAVSAAWKCALGAYDLASSLADTESCSFHRVRLVNPSLGGTVKALTVTVVSPRLEWERQNPFLPALVIAIRGSASKTDHLVNANGERKDAQHLLVCGMRGYRPRNYRHSLTDSSRSRKWTVGQTLAHTADSSGVQMPWKLWFRKPSGILQLLKA